MGHPKIKRAIISVSDKTGIVALAEALKNLGVDIISTGGTAKHLNENDLSTTSVSDITGFPEILGGRVKSLHPKIFGGLLALRDNAGQMKELQKHDIAPIDMVVVNLYPFQETVSQPGIVLADALENIDIGGPSLIRAAAKNFPAVVVVTSPGQYSDIIAELKANHGEVTLAMRKQLAAAAFAHTAGYDSNIESYLAAEEAGESDMPEYFSCRWQKTQDLRYGENPHQQAALYRDRQKKPFGLLGAKQLHGKELSFNNFIDTDAVLGMLQEFAEPCAVIVKHTNPCGVATGDTLERAFSNAKATDPVSAFGGIIGFNREVDESTARAISEMFVEVILAPEFSPQALAILQSKKNVRLLQLSPSDDAAAIRFDIKTVQGGYLLQESDQKQVTDEEMKVVTKRQPTEDEWRALKFGWKICKWVKSNAIVYAKPDRTIGIGAGQMSRVDSANIAIEKAKRMELDLTGTAMASDAFFPFRDGIDVAAEAGATAVIQPGGSIRDDEVIAAADEHNMTMVLTGIRHFKH